MITGGRDIYQASMGVDMALLFYGIKSEEIESVEAVADGYRHEFWVPTCDHLVPRGMSCFPYLLWSFLHYLRIFHNRDYSIFLVFHNDRIIHQSIITPGYFRFPFMAFDDLQIGDVWTDEKHRGKGITICAIRNIVNHHSKPGRKFWYIVDQGNIPSIKAAERAGLVEICQGVKKKLFGLNLLATFRKTDD